MNPLILLETKEKFNNFELSRIKKSLIYSLKMNNKLYVSSIYDEIYDLVHFLRISDIVKYSSDIKKKAKKVISVLFSEEDKNGRILEINNDKYEESLFTISKTNVELLNKCDLVLVPSLEAKKFLNRNGVTSEISLFTTPIRHSVFDLKNSILNKIIFRYLSLNEESILIVTTLYFEDINAYEKLFNIAKEFPKYKFITISHKDVTKEISLKMKNLLKNKPSNVMLSTPFEEDVYLSLLYNATIFLNIGSTPGNDIEMLEAMASKTQILSLKDSSWSDFLINGETGYIFEDLEELKIGIKQYFDALLEKTIDKGYNYSKKYSISNYGETLIELYKKVLED